MLPTAVDEAKVRYLLAKALEHSSGGTYDMAAMIVRGKTQIIGYNRLDDPASRHSDGYKPLHGRHAEQHVKQLCDKRRLDMAAGTLYVVGFRKVNQMWNTYPCDMCRNWLDVKHVVYFSEGALKKEAWRGPYKD